MGDISKKGHGIERRGPHGHASQPHLSIHNKGGRVGHNKGGRAGRQIGGRANLLEEVGRLDAERMNPNRRAEKSRVIGELNRGYAEGGPAKPSAESKVVGPRKRKAEGGRIGLIKGFPKLAKRGWK